MRGQDVPASPGVPFQDASDDSDVTDLAAGITDAFTIVAGAQLENIDAGLIELKGSIAGFYFSDDDDNGFESAGDEPIQEAGVLLQQLQADGTFLTVDDTFSSFEAGQEGTYAFTDLDAGTYRVAFQQQVGTSFVTSPAGTDSALNSDVDPTIADAPVGFGVTGPLVINGNDLIDIDAGARDNPTFNLNGTVNAFEPGSQSITFIIDFTTDMFEGPANATTTDVNGDQFLTPIDAVLTQIAEEVALLDESQSVHFILVNDEGVVDELTTTANFVAEKQADGDLVSLYAPVFLQTVGTAVDNGGNLRSVDFAAGLEAAKAYITDPVFGFSPTEGAAQDTIIIITAEDGTTDFIEATGESVPAFDFSGIRAELVDELGADIDVVAINSDISLAAIDGTFDLGDRTVIAEDNDFDPLVLVDIDTDGVIRNATDAEDFGLDGLLENNSIEITGEVVAVQTGSDVFSVADGDIVDLDPRAEVFQFELTGLEAVDPNDVFLIVDRSDGTPEEAVQVPATEIVQDDDNFVFVFDLTAEDPVFGG